MGEAEWGFTTLGQIATKIGSGATPRGGSSVYVHAGTAFIRSQNVLDFHFSDSGLAYITEDAAEALRGVSVSDGDVLVNITGDSVARVCAAPKIAARVSQHVAIVRPDPQLGDSRFIMYSLLNPPMKARLLNTSSSGATRKALTKEHLQSLPVALPPLSEQRRIAGVLGALDDLIEVNRGLAGDCEQLAQSLAASSQTTTALSSFTTWGGLPAVKPVGPVHHYSLPAFDDGRNPEHVDGSLIKSNKQRISDPCVLVARLNPHIPRVWMAYPEPSVSSLASTEFVPISGHAVSNEAVYAVCSAPAFLEQMNGLVTGTTGSHQRVDKDALTSVDVPDVRTLSTETLDAVALLVRQAHALRVEIKELASTRDELLPLLLSGRVRVGDVAA